jgi:hypothetical protein
MTLKSDILSDLTESFFNSDASEFAVEATWNLTTVKGIFDNDFFEVEVGEVGVQGNQPRFFCASADISGLGEGDAIVIGGVTYNAIREEPDGTGVSLIILRESA